MYLFTALNICIKSVNWNLRHETSVSKDLVWNNYCDMKLSILRSCMVQALALVKQDNIFNVAYELTLILSTGLSLVFNRMKATFGGLASGIKACAL